MLKNGEDNERSLINKYDTDYTGNTNTTNTIKEKIIWTLIH